MFVRSVGSVSKTGPVRSGLRSRIGLALISVRIGSTKFFPTAWNFQKKSLERRDRFRQKIVEIGAILAIFEPFEVWKIRVPFFGEFGQSSQDLGDSEIPGRSAEFAQKWHVDFSHVSWSKFCRTAKLWTAQKSRGWLRFRWFFDEIDRVEPI